MGPVWLVLILASAAVSLAAGTAAQAGAALMASGESSLKLLMTLLASMPLWSGLMEILSASGDLTRLGRLFRRIARSLFPGLQDAGCWDAISMNLAANLLGLGNAATPAGIEAAQRLAAQGETGLRALAMLLALDNASLQLLPTTVITLRQAAGACDPADVWGMTILISGVSTVAAAAMMKLCFALAGRRRA